MADTKLSSLIRNPAILDEDDMASDSATAAASQQSIKAYSDAIKASISTPIFWNMFTHIPDVVGQGTWVIIISNTLLYNAIFYNSSGNDGDNFTCNFRCPAGTYKIMFNASKASDRGIVDVYIDGSEEASFDLYAAVFDPDYIASVAGLVLTAGAHTLKFQLDGKNGASANHVFAAGGISIQRTA